MAFFVLDWAAALTRAVRAAASDSHQDHRDDREWARKNCPHPAENLPMWECLIIPACAGADSSLAIHFSHWVDADAPQTEEATTKSGHYCHDSCNKICNDIESKALESPQEEKQDHHEENHSSHYQENCTSKCPPVISRSPALHDFMCC